MNQNEVAASARAGQQGKLPPGWRKLLLTVHVVVSVGLIGADASVVMLGLTGLVSGAPELIRASYLVMELLVESIMLPFAFSALLTGIVLAVGTQWGLARYYWVLTKLVLTTGAVSALVLVLRPRIHQAAAQALEIPLAELATTGIGQVGFAVTIGPAGALLALLTVTILAVYKPWGQIWLRRRTEPARARMLHLDQQSQ